MRSYEAARTYFSILEFAAWCVVILGGIVAVIAMATIGGMSREFGGSSMAGLSGILPGLVVAFAGFMGLVLAQIGRAGVDTAEYSQQMLKIARDQLEVSRQGLRGSNAPSKSFSDAVEMTSQTSSSYGSLASEGGGSDSAPPPAADEDALSGASRTIEHRGMKIENYGIGYRAGQEMFVRLDAARQHIDNLLEREIPTGIPQEQADEAEISKQE